MAIPATNQPFPQRQRAVYSRSTGLALNPRQSVGTAPAQGNPASPISQVSHIGSGSGSVTLNATVTGTQTFTTYVPLSLPVPLSPSSVLKFAPGSPVITLPSGATLGSVTVLPCVRTTLSSSSGGTPIGAATIGPGITVQQFFCKVVFQAAGLKSGGAITVSASGDLFA